MTHQIVQPHEALRAYVKEYLLVHFDFTGFTEIPTKLFPPRGDSSIIFYPSNTFMKVNPALNKKVAIPSSIIQGQLLTNWYHHYPKEFKVVKIVFQPSGLFHLLGKMPLTYVLDAVIDAESVIGKEGNDILQQLMDTEKYNEMIAVVELYLLKKYQKIKQHLEPIDKISRLLQFSNNQYSLDYLANQSCLSFRQFERKFRERVGISPKLFTRIIRFNHAFAIKEANPDKDWLEIAMTCGYSDYQHMVKDFKQFAGVTPTILMKENDLCPEKILGLTKLVVF